METRVTFALVDVKRAIFSMPACFTRAPIVSRCVRASAVVQTDGVLALVHILTAVKPCPRAPTIARISPWIIDTGAPVITGVGSTLIYVVCTCATSVPFIAHTLVTADEVDALTMTTAHHRVALTALVKVRVARAPGPLRITGTRVPARDIVANPVVCTRLPPRFALVHVIAAIAARPDDETLACVTTVGVMARAAIPTRRYRDTLVHVRVATEPRPTDVTITSTAENM